MECKIYVFRKQINRKQRTEIQKIYFELDLRWLFLQNMSFASSSDDFLNKVSGYQVDEEKGLTLLGF